MIAVSPDQLVRVLLDLRSAQPITFTARTDADAKAKDANKNPNPHPRPVWKTTTVNAMVNFWYEDGVLRRLQKEGKNADDFKRGTSWHEPVMIDGRLTPLCQAKSEQNRNLYLRCMFLATVNGPDYTDNNGKPLTHDEVAPFLKPRSDYGNQGLDAPLVFLTYSLAGILNLTAQGQTYAVNHSAAAVA